MKDKIFTKNLILLDIFKFILFAAIANVLLSSITDACQGKKVKYLVVCKNL